MSEFERICKLIDPKTNRNGLESFIAHLDCFSEYSGTNRWERWLQYELLFLLSKGNHKTLRDPKFEKQYAYDKRYKLPAAKNGKSKAQIDFLYGLGGDDRDLYHAVELKMSNSLKGVLRSGLQDLLRIQAIKEKWAFRSVTLFAVFVDDKRIAPEYRNIRDELENSLSFFRIIELNKKYSVLLFGWSAQPRSVCKDAYIKWVNAADAIYQKHGINVWKSDVSRS